ncbi:FtsW/RodA/SpoVE family cell cycle protein, partial [Streptomyces anulatus]
MSTPIVEPVLLPAKRRVAQLAMLAFAVVIVMGAYANVGLAIDKQVPAGMLTYGLGLGGFMLA